MVLIKEIDRLIFEKTDDDLFREVIRTLKEWGFYYYYNHDIKDAICLDIFLENKVLHVEGKLFLKSYRYGYVPILSSKEDLIAYYTQYELVR